MKPCIPLKFILPHGSKWFQNIWSRYTKNTWLCQWSHVLVPVSLSICLLGGWTLTLTRCGASWRVSWKCGSVSLQVIQECFRTCSAVYRWWGSTWSIWDSRSWNIEEHPVLKVYVKGTVSSAFPSYDLKHYGCLYTVLSMFPLIKLAKFSILAHIRQCTTYATDMKNY